MEKIIIGKVVNVVGIKGEIKVYNYAEHKERYETLDKIFLGKEGKLDKTEEYEIENVRYKDHMVILKLVGINDRNQAESLRDYMVYMDEADLEELPEGVYYIRDILGFDIVSDTGEHLGILKDVLTNTSQKVYVIGRESKPDFLVPAVDEFILDTDLEKRQITIKVIEGLYEDWCTNTVPRNVWRS